MSTRFSEQGTENLGRSPYESPTNGHTSLPKPHSLNGTREGKSHGIQVIDEDQNFNEGLSDYLASERIARAGFNYHVISVFGSQSTGKSTLLNHLFGTDFGVMSENERRQTTRGIWLSRNQNPGDDTRGSSMAENILIMDVEGTDGRERGEDQDFERKSALFALATSEVLIVNIWEHQVGLYQGANMGLLKVVFEVNMELFLKEKSKDSSTKSLLYFVIRDHLGTTPLSNLRNTLAADLTRIWASINKPAGLEHSRIEDYFDFAFAALPHKILQPEKFTAEVHQLGSHFHMGRRKGDPAQEGREAETGILLPEYHRRIPADGFSHYANGIWEQIVNNKDLDLPTQQELLAQFRCDEITREVFETFDKIIQPFELQQSASTQSGRIRCLEGLGPAMQLARSGAIESFETEASRYHRGVYRRKLAELQAAVDSRLKILFKGQLSALHKAGLDSFNDAVRGSLRSGQRRGSSYNFRDIVEHEKSSAINQFEREAEAAKVDEAPWSDYAQEFGLFKEDVDEVAGRLRRDELQRVVTKIEKSTRTRLGEQVALEFKALGAGRPLASAAGQDSVAPEKELWDRIWELFLKTSNEAISKFQQRAKSLDASIEEAEMSLWRLRRKSWTALRAKIEEELMDGNILLKLRENFEDKFKYDESGVPRIWRPTDDIEDLYSKARESTLNLISTLSQFRLYKTSSFPLLREWLGNAPDDATLDDQDDLNSIGGIDLDDGKTLDDELTFLNDSKRQDLTVRFRKTADGVFVEAKRSAIGGMTQVPLYFYGLLLALGWNEIVAVLRNPVYFLLLIMLAAAAYVTYNLNLWGPMLAMANAASAQALQEFKKALRDFLESTDTGREAIAMSNRTANAISSPGREYAKDPNDESNGSDDDQ